MRRLLTTTMALGLVVTAMGFSGIYAVFTDRASTGTNSVDSGEQPRAADLQIGAAVQPDCSDATFTDNLLTGIFDLSDVLPGSDSTQHFKLCVKNVGTAGLFLTVAATDVVETETDCTGDEAAAGDLTCGTPDIGDGELGTVLTTQIVPYDCETFFDIPGVLVTSSIADLATTPGEFGSIAAGDTFCLDVIIFMPTAGAYATSDEVQQAQTDKVEWRYAFDGTAS